MVDWDSIGCHGKDHDYPAHSRVLEHFEHLLELRWTLQPESWVEVECVTPTEEGDVFLVDPWIYCKKRVPEAITTVAP